MLALSTFLNHPEQHLYGFSHLAVPVGFKVIFAIICGGLIGLEREIKSKPAGIKTNILICLGSALYSIISILLANSFSDSGHHGDPARVSAQIVSGIGFLGAGAIIRSGANIVGLTTAATIWVVAAIGVCIGSGYPVVAFVFTVTVLFTLLAIDKLEAKFLGRGGGHSLEVIFEDDEGVTRGQINQLMAANEISLEDFDISRSGNHYVLRLQYVSPFAIHKRFILGLWGIKGIREVRQA